MRESYTQEPKTVELFRVGGHTDVVIRRNITYRQSEDDRGNVQDTWDCDEVQFRYPGALSAAEVEAQPETWLAYAGAESMDTLETAKRAAVAVMSDTCASAIKAGFDVELSDKKLHHFSLEITDQIMISLLAGKVAAGVTSVPWHADGEICKFFSAEDIAAVNMQMEALITYHETYFNSLKHYILAMETPEEVNAAYYGMPIPEVHQSEVLRTILAVDEEERANAEESV